MSGGPMHVFGPLVYIHNLLAAYLNTCVDYVIPHDHVYGIQLDNGTWNGIMGQVTRKEVDMSGTLMYMDASRQRAVDTSVALFINDKILTYKRPVPQADLAGFLKPFTPMMWCMILLTVTVMVTVILWTQRLQNKFINPDALVKDGEEEQEETRRRLSEDERQQPLPTLWTSCLWSFSALLALSSRWWPQGTVLQVMAGVWLLAALVITTVYRSNLMAMLIIPKLHLPFNTLQELLNTNIPCYVAQGTVLLTDILAAEPGSQLHRLRKQMITHSNVKKTELDVLQGKYASFSSRLAVLSSIHNIFSTTKSCPLYIASETFFGSSSLCFVFPKGSHLSRKLNPVLMKLQEAGIVDHVYLEGIRHAQKCLKPDSTLTSLRTLQLDDFYGMLLGIVVFLLEIMIVMYYRHR
ncbi:glutamate receptor-like isoform X2 [Cherax quadricarinatus]|uniref:glutamate receptor-like isoform X2 n=1 Tax=Cherax quadricarinatus TaxID=27406 RepID=UPI00387E8D55